MWYHRGLNSVPQCCRAHVVPRQRSVAASLCAPVPAGGLALSARARVKHVIRATRVTQIPDGTRSGLLRPFLVQFSNAPARVFIDMHVRIVDGGRKWMRRACRSVDRKIDRSTDRFKKTSLRRSASPRGLLFLLCGATRLPSARGAISACLRLVYTVGLVVFSLAPPRAPKALATSVARPRGEPSGDDPRGFG